MTLPTLSPHATETIATVAEALVTWYRQVARDLPWRHTQNPYHIWLSEIMLQQTQVVTVLSYYPRFLTRFPTIEALASAPSEAVLSLWQGLGYYTRCRNLHKAAQKILAEHGGQFPNTLEAVQALPGVGRSTAGAILTFAFGQRHPILDGNVQRILCRIFDVPGLPTSPPINRHLWELSRQLVATAHDPFSLNQALMELGATICLPNTTPKCLICPVADVCQARAFGTITERPVKAVKKPIPHVQVAIGVLEHPEKPGVWYFQKRPDEGFLGGLWEFPGGKIEPDEAPAAACQREFQEETGLQVAAMAFLGKVSHAYTHFKVTFHVFRCALDPIDQPLQALPGVWTDTPAELPLPTGTVKILRQCLNSSI
jgi:A/G-specific adenine glycosylase